MRHMLWILHPLVPRTSLLIVKSFKCICENKPLRIFVEENSTYIIVISVLQKCKHKMYKQQCLYMLGRISNVNLWLRWYHKVTPVAQSRLAA